MASLVERFYGDGLVQLPSVGGADVARNDAGLEEITARLRGAPLSTSTFCQERYFPILFEMAKTPAILDAVEQILGPDFFLWGVHVVSKGPGHVGYSWHQDRPHFPFRYQDQSAHPASMPITVTAWLAIDDADVNNGAFPWVPGSHRRGVLPHVDIPMKGLDDEGIRELSTVDPSIFELPAETHNNELPAGHFSLHHDLLVHGSGPNLSGRRRAGVSIHYSRTDVELDRSVWPNLRVRLMRGRDVHRLNPTWSDAEFTSRPVDLEEHEHA